jgi:hypothetical protein
MARPEHFGHAALVGWRKALADRVAPRAAEKAPLSEQQARAVIGGLFFALSLFYVTSTVKRMVQTARG